MSDPAESSHQETHSEPPQHITQQNSTGADDNIKIDWIPKNMYRGKHGSKRARDTRELARQELENRVKKDCKNQTAVEGQICTAIVLHGWHQSRSEQREHATVSGLNENQKPFVVGHIMRSVNETSVFSPGAYVKSSGWIQKQDHSQGTD